MIHRLLGALALFLLWASVVFAEPVTITFDDTDTLTYTVGGTDIHTEYGCASDNRCLIATAERGAVGQRVTITVTFERPVIIYNVQVDYSLSVDGVPSRYAGGTWDLEVTHNGRFQFSGTVGHELSFDGVWHTASTLDNNLFARFFWRTRAPFTGDTLRIQVRPATQLHDGAEIRIDNIVIDYEPT